MNDSNNDDVNYPENFDGMQHQIDEQQNDDLMNQNINLQDENKSEPNIYEDGQEKNDFRSGNNNQPQTNFQYNKDSNLTEEISNKTMNSVNKCLEKIGKYFNVELPDIKQKLKGAVIPFNKSFYQSIETNTDLYGPFWTFTTIIFLIAIFCNIHSYFNTVDKTQFKYDFTCVPHSALIIYGFGFGVPFILWIISRFVFKIDINLITNLCVYGYSYVILIPVLIICVIPFNIVCTLALLYFLVHSCIFLFYNMFLLIQQKAPKSKYLVLGLLGGVQLILFLTLRYYFFNKGSDEVPKEVTE